MHCPVDDQDSSFSTHCSWSHGPVGFSVPFVLLSFFSAMFPLAIWRSVNSVFTIILIIRDRSWLFLLETNLTSIFLTTLCRTSGDDCRLRLTGNHHLLWDLVLNLKIPWKKDIYYLINKFTDDNSDARHNTSYNSRTLYPPQCVPLVIWGKTGCRSWWHQRWRSRTPPRPG